MTEKRFTAFTDYLGGTQTILDNGERKTLQELLDTMNELADENEQLKKDNKEYIRGLDLSKATSQSWASDVRELREQNYQLEKENEQLKHNNKMLSMKMSEVYTKYYLLYEFSEDTNPNDAVKRILSELMQTTKEYR